MVGRGDISSVLSQIRALKSEAQQGIRPANLPSVDQVGSQDQVKKTDFTDLLKSAVDSVNNQQVQAKAMVTAYERGDQGVDLAQVMIQAQKASVSFQALTQVRNRLITAYEDIAKMPI